MYSTPFFESGVNVKDTESKKTPVLDIRVIRDIHMF